MASTRLPGKPLADIAGLPMIVQVLRRAEEAKHRSGGGGDRHGRDRPGGHRPWRRGGHDARRPSLRLRPDFRGAGEARSGRQDRDRSSICRAICPTIPPDDIRAVLAPLADPAVDIATLAAEIHVAEEHTQSERGEGDRLAIVRSSGCARFISRARPRRRAKGRAIITSASMPIAGQRWRTSSRCRRRRWSSANGSSSCGRSRPACASM